MTVGVMFMGLVPIMWSSGAGSDVMRRIAAPMMGGIFTSFILLLATGCGDKPSGTARMTHRRRCFIPPESISVRTDFQEEKIWPPTKIFAYQDKFLFVSDVAKNRIYKLQVMEGEK